MSNQKHTVSTDALDTLGTCPIPENSGRDAIHLAVEPVVSRHYLEAGQRIAMKDGFAVPAGLNIPATGIADPFVAGTIRPYEKFWFVVLPRTITSLRHVWSHPAFPEAVTPEGNDPLAFVPEQSMAMAWMKEFCAEIGERYDYIMEGARKYIEAGDYTYGEKDSGNLEGVDITSEFWEKYEAITGKKVPVNDRGSFFRCSC
jgi:hypothetical protein